VRHWVNHCSAGFHEQYSGQPLAVMEGHQDRVCRVAFHPSGRYVASASFDTSWRLWDVNTAKELLLQEGHSKEVYSVDFQNDGALVVSGSVLSFPCDI
jgi:U4/U6 small nuclear ribonucleoprotein PRP4